MHRGGRGEKGAMGCFGKEEERKMEHYGKGERERMEERGGKQQGLFLSFYGHEKWRRRRETASGSAEGWSVMEK